MAVYEQGVGAGGRSRVGATRWGGLEIECDAMSPSRSLDVLSRIVIAGMSVVVGVVAIVILVQALLSAALSAESLTYGQLKTYLDVHPPVMLACAVVLLLGAFATGVAFLAWLYRTRHNLDRLPGVRPRWPRRWVFLAWLLPGANLVLPAAVAADVARTSAGHRAARLAWAWWAALIGSLVVTGWMAARAPSERSIGYLYSSPSDRVSSGVRAEAVDFFGVGNWVADLPIAGLLLAAAVFGARLVRAVTAAQRARLQGIGETL